MENKNPKSILERIQELFLRLNERQIKSENNEGSEKRTISSDIEREIREIKALIKADKTIARNRYGM